MEIYTYNAGKGDCLRIRFGTGHNILVDSGVRRFGLRFLQICEQIHADGEKIDLLIITHMDEDHLGGALYAAGTKRALHIAQVWMNCAANTALMPDAPLSAGQNNMLFRRLSGRGIPVSSAIRGNCLSIDGASLEVLWPTEEVAGAIYRKPGTTLLARQSDHGFSLEELAKRPILRHDTSGSNRASVVFVFRYAGKNLLFAGDAWGEDVLRAISGEEHFDMIKLPHHGAVGNITEDWKRIVCKSFLLCADGKDHPDKQTIAKLMGWNGGITIYSPCNWWEDGFFIPEDDETRVRLVAADGQQIQLMGQEE